MSSGTLLLKLCAETGKMYKNVSESQQSKISWKAKLLMNPGHFCSSSQHCISLTSALHMLLCHATPTNAAWLTSDLHLQYAINAAFLLLTPICCYLTLKNIEDAPGPTVSIFSQDSFTWKQKYIYLSMQNLCSSFVNGKIACIPINLLKTNFLIVYHQILALYTYLI